ncbi:MAG: four helix bundle protein, partial [Bacteroidota bacterium]
MDNRKFDLEDWLIEFSVLIIGVVETLPTTRVGNHIAGQLLRSGTAAAPEYGEAQGAESRRDFIHKLKIGLKELRETRVWLKLLKHKAITPSADVIDCALAECGELTAIFASSISTAKKNLGEAGGNIQ